ncbi:3-deoxy-manno-octulosonate cytidylyltransferase [bacterium BMS3Abin08]|nr:3-deoxy-manno-octulosonate cytidylyltransferase [bacterium BMS3Abin08]
MMSQNIVIIVQARSGSTRLSHKVLKTLAGKTVLYHMVKRVERARLANRVVVATTTDPGDDVIEFICRENGFECFRGHPTDLLDRHYKAGINCNADVVVKIPSDCPLIDPQIIDRVLRYYLDNRERFDYVSNLHPPTYPDGNDVEIIPMQVLEIAWKEAKKNFEREHTTPFIWNSPERFSIGNVTWETGLDFSNILRWVLDFEEDYQFVKTVYDELYHVDPLFGFDDILHLLSIRPEITDINKMHRGMNWYGQYLHELKACALL